MALWTQEDIDVLRAAVASGILTVTYSGPPSRTVTYQNLDAMRRLLAAMQAEVTAEAGTGTRYRLASTRKGL